MNNSALVRIHRLKCEASAGAQNSCRILFCKRNQRRFTLFAVIADIDRHTAIALSALVFHHTGKVLNRVQRFAASADDNAVIVAANPSALTKATM